MSLVFFSFAHISILHFGQNEEIAKMGSFHQSKRSDNKRYTVEVRWGIFFENLTYFFIPQSGRRYAHTNSYNSALTVIAQDDHLAAGAWAACDLISEFEKNGVNSEHSYCKWIIPEVPIAIFTPIFHFFAVNLIKNGIKSEKLSSKWNRSQVTISNLQPDFPFFSQWILEKRDKFCEIHPLGGFYPIDLP